MKTCESNSQRRFVSSLLAGMFVLTLLLTTVWTVFAATPIYVRTDGNDINCDGTADVAYPGGGPGLACAVATIQKGVDLVDLGGTVYVRAGTYTVPSQININKAGVILDGDGAGVTVVQVSGTGHRFYITASGVTLQDFEIVKTDKTGVQNIIYVGAANITIQNNTIHGQYVYGEGDTSRAMEVAYGSANLSITGNTFYGLRQPAYMNGQAASPTTGTIANNLTYGTKGWVIAGANMTFSNNSWGNGNIVDVAILNVADNIGLYPDLLAISAANNDAAIENQVHNPGLYTVVRVDDSYTFVSDALQTTVTNGIAKVLSGGKVKVAAGIYNEDVNLNKTASLIGAGIDQAVIRGVKSAVNAESATVRISANGALVEGFTITRNGNNVAEWNDNLNLMGVGIQTVGNATIRNNKITGNRTGIDINFSSGNLIKNNVVDFNRSGIILRNQCPNNTVQENEIINNWTVGILWLAASTEDATGTTFYNNKIEGNWYTQIENRSTTGGIKNFSGNWLGSAAPTTSNTNGSEPGYADLIPVEYGGSATPPGGAIAVRGAGLGDMDYTPWLAGSTDTDLVTTGFQGDFSTLYVDDDSAQYGTAGRIQEGVDLVSGSTIYVLAGTYAENIVIDKPLNLFGPNAAINPNTSVRGTEAVIIPPTSDPDPTSPTSSPIMYLISGANNVTIQGFTVDGDNPSLTSGVLVNGVDVDAIEAISSYEGVGGINISNNIIQNVSYAGLDFYNYNNGGSATANNTIRFNKFHNIGHIPYGFGIGILVYNNFYAEITDNVLTNVRVGIQTGNFFQANPGPAAVISNNTISTTRRGIFHNLAYSSASPFTISNNTFTVQDEPGATRWDAIMLSSLANPVGVTVQNNTITATPVTQVTVGYQVWNDTTASIVISGGSVSGANYGVWINNYDGYGPSNGSSTIATISGVSISNATLAGIYVKDNPLNTNGATVAAVVNNGTTISDSVVGVLAEGADATATVTNSTIKDNGTGVLVKDAAVGSFNQNDFYGNTSFAINNTTTTTVNAIDSYWGSSTGPTHSGNPGGDGDAVTDYVDYSPYGVTSGEDLQDIVDDACGGSLTLEAIAYVGGVNVSCPLTIRGVPGTIVTAGSPAFIINSDNVTIQDLAIDGDPGGTTKALFSGVVVNAVDNFVLQNTEITDWTDGVEIAGNVTNLKIVSNWIHRNGTGLKVNPGVTVDQSGTGAIEGNLFKENTTAGVDNQGTTDPLDVTYNSWGAYSGPTEASGNPGGLGDDVLGSAAYYPWTFAELFLDVAPDTLASSRTVSESTSFNVALKADAQTLNGVSFRFTYDPTLLTLNSATPSGSWNCTSASAAGVVDYYCVDFTGSVSAQPGTVMTFNFTATGSGLTGNGPWTNTFDLAHLEAETSAGATGGVKVFVNNAGYDTPGPRGDISDTNDGQITINGIAQFSGYIDLQGRTNDSGATIRVYNSSDVGTAIQYAQATSASSGQFTTALTGSNLLVIGSTYYFQVDARFYLPTTQTGALAYNHNKALTARPATLLSTVILLGGDATDNNQVDLDDATTIGSLFGSTGVSCPVSGACADVNGDGKVDLYDLVLMGGNYNLDRSLWSSP